MEFLQLSVMNLSKLDQPHLRYSEALVGGFSRGSKTFRILDSEWFESSPAPCHYFQTSVQMCHTVPTQLLPLPRQTMPCAKNN
jgi:hypothetical protein